MLENVSKRSHAAEFRGNRSVSSRIYYFYAETIINVQRFHPLKMFELRKDSKHPTAIWDIAVKLFER